MPSTEPPITGRNGKQMRCVATRTTTPTTDDKSKEVPCPCGCTDTAVDIARYIVGEMKKNPFTDVGKQITQANRFSPSAEIEEWKKQPWYTKLGGMPDYYGMAAGLRAGAMMKWASYVRPHGPWDHKPIIEKMLIAKGLFNRGWHKYGQYDYFYDIWSNIHYGYVGCAVGFGASTLIGGAGLAQVGSDVGSDLSKTHLPTIQQHPENGSFPASADDVQDHISIKLGIDLYNAVKPDKLTPDILLRNIATVPVPWGQDDGEDHGKKRHRCSCAGESSIEIPKSSADH